MKKEIFPEKDGLTPKMFECVSGVKRKKDKLVNYLRCFEVRNALKLQQYYFIIVLHKKGSK